MKLRLAHHTPPRAELDGRELFRWNTETIDQFVLVDPLDQGWKLVSIPKKGGVPAHLLLKAPLTWNGACGPVFIVVREDLEEDHVVHSVHDLPDHAIVGNVDRYTGPEDFVATCRESGTVRTFLCDAGVTENLQTVHTDEGAIVRTESSCVGGLLSAAGTSVVSLFEGEYLAASSKKVGFMAGFSQDGVHGGEAIRIFDFYVERVR